MHVRFDRFELDVGRRALFAGGEPVHLSPKAFRLLEILVGNSPRALSKRELTEAIWPDTFVEESNLASLVADLRTALGDRTREAQFVRTVHGFGYAFSCEVTPVERPQRAATLIFDGKEIPLYAGDNILGRDPTSGILIDHATVSRRHACVAVADDAATLEDLGSKNGTFLDDAKITAKTALPDGTTFVLGDARVLFRRSGVGASTLTLSG